MPASFPGAVKTFTTKVDGAGNIIFAAHVNDLQDEVTAIEQYLVGTGVSTVIVPDATRTRDLGSTTRRWRDLFMGRTIDMDQGTITADAQAWKSVATWNNGAVAFTHNLTDITDTASSASSFLEIWRIGGGTRFAIRKDGLLTVGGAGGGLDFTTGAAVTLGTTDAFDLQFKRNNTNIVILKSNRLELQTSINLDSVGDMVISRANTQKITIETARVVFADSIAVGATPATVGDLRIPNNSAGVTARNAANSANIRLISLTSSNQIRLGDPSSSEDIIWATTLVSLGGGATPTFGTIGGSGPATAVQNSWMRVIDNTGNAFWVPVWK